MNPPEDWEILHAALAIANGEALEGHDDRIDPQTLSRLRILEEIAGAFVELRPGALAIGTLPALFQWGSLEARRAIGEGGYGEVFAAWDPALEREVALKLRRARSGVLHWLDEARRLARVRHPNVVVVHGADLRDDRAGIWTELIQGRTLEDELRARGPLPSLEATRIARDVASALDAVHRAGLVHGDVTARNVMLEAPGPQAPWERVVLMDFGAATESAARAAGVPAATPLAAAPEVLDGQPATPTSDLYGLGVLLSRMLTGRYPVEAETIEELRSRHAGKDRARLAGTRTGIPSLLARVGEALLARQPSRRPESAAAVRDALTRVLGERLQRDRRLAWGAAAAGLALAAISALVIQGYRTRENFRRYRALPPSRLAMSVIPVWTAPLDSATYDRGWWVDLSGDYDGDGYKDLTVSHSVYSNRVHHGGRVEVYRGTPGGPSRELSWSYEGTQAGQEMGASLASVGDVNGDGYDDLVEGDLGYTQRPGFASGAVRLFLGSKRGLSTRPQTTIVGEQRDAFFGSFEAAAGDVNGDGFDDVLVGERNWSGGFSNEGRVSLYLGTRDGLASLPAWVRSGGREGIRFGWGAAGVGDVDGDGFDDVVIGAPMWSEGKIERGALFLFRGRREGLEARPWQVIVGEAELDGIGIERTIVRIGDLNRDGFADIAYAAMGHSHGAKNDGRIYVRLGGPRGFSARPSWTADGFGGSCLLGSSMVGGADIDRDGRADLVVGGPGYTRSADTTLVGMVAIYRGSDHLFESAPAWSVVGSQSRANFGIAVALGDADGDGYADVVAGEPHWSDGHERRGRVTLYRGAGVKAR